LAFCRCFPPRPPRGGRVVASTAAAIATSTTHIASESSPRAAPPPATPPAPPTVPPLLDPHSEEPASGATPLPLDDAPS
jgi:hypothetical protein